MKKKFIFAFVLLSASQIWAQDSLAKKNIDDILRNKKGFEILPKQGDLAIGFNTFPIIDLFLGSINRTTAYAGSSNLVQFTQNANNQIMGKYFLDAKTAIRVRLGVNTLAGNIVNQVQDANAAFQASKGTQADRDAAALLKVEDKASFVKTNWMLTVGYEKRRGYRRLQGFYGGEIGFGSTSSSQSFSYGNKFSDQYNVSYTTDFNNRLTAVQTPTFSNFGQQRAVRTLERSDKSGFRLGVRGFVGIEYFIFSKISIAAEYGWAYSLTRTRPSTSKQEVYFVGQNGPTVITEKINADSRELSQGFSVDNNSGAVFSMNNTLNGNTVLSGGAGALTLIFHF